MSTNLHLIIKPHGIERITERKIVNVIARMITEIMELKRRT